MRFPECANEPEGPVYELIAREDLRVSYRPSPTVDIPLASSSTATPRYPLRSRATSKFRTPREASCG